MAAGGGEPLRVKVVLLKLGGLPRAPGGREPKHLQLVKLMECVSGVVCAPLPLLAQKDIVPTPGKASRHIRGTVGNSEAAHTVVPGKAGAHLAHRRLHARIANPRSQP
eukprot:362760-Prorocentrum_minimum.AAC.1